MIKVGPPHLLDLTEHRRLVPDPYEPYRRVLKDDECISMSILFSPLATL
jgi:hypothetical protein